MAYAYTQVNSEKNSEKKKKIEREKGRYARKTKDVETLGEISGVGQKKPTWKSINPTWKSIAVGTVVVCVITHTHTTSALI